MNEIQKKAFELLELFVGICEKWNIDYYLVCGSALGAVKYQGFIPWDDDIDVAMLRKDYVRFLEIAPKELPDWCFLQNYTTDYAYPRIGTKLRNSNTTFMEIGVEHLPIHHGIYIDIFPLDGHPEYVLEKISFEIKKKLYLWQCFCGLSGHESMRVSVRNKVFRMLGYHKRTQRTLKKLESLYTSYVPEKSDLWCNYGNSTDRKEYAPRWHYGAGTWAAFEGLRVRIPEQYDAYLTQKYGNWREDPPKEKQISNHHYKFCDVSIPYTEYVDEKIPMDS